jgi:hypothetical protein
VKDEVKKIRKQDNENNQERKQWPMELRLKVELAEAFEIIHSIYTPTALTMKTAIQRLDVITKSTPAAVSRLTSRPNTSSHLVLENGSPMLFSASDSRPGTAGNVNTLVISPGTESRPQTSGGLIMNNNSQSQSSMVSKAPSRPGSSWQSRPGTSGGLLPFAFSGTVTRPQTADSETAAMVAGSSASKYFIGRYAFRRLINYGKVLNLDLVEIDEFFRNIDYSAFCYITLQDVYPWFKKKALRIKGFQFKVSDVLSVEERALIAIFLRFLNEKDLLGLPPPKKKKRKNKYEEAMSKYSEGKRNKPVDYYDSEEEESDGEVEVEDEDALFSDLNKLKNCDIGRLMRYLTRKKEQELQAQRLHEEEQKQILALKNEVNHEGDILFNDGEPHVVERLQLDGDPNQEEHPIKEGFEAPIAPDDTKGKDL